MMEYLYWAIGLLAFEIVLGLAIGHWLSASAKHYDRSQRDSHD